VVLILDATHLERNLYLAGQVLELGLPTIVALSMVDLAERDGIEIDHERLAAELGCPVVPVVARNRRGVEELRQRLADLVRELPADEPLPPAIGACGCDGCPFQKRFDWAERLGQRCVRRP